MRASVRTVVVILAVALGVPLLEAGPAGAAPTAPTLTAPASGATGAGNPTMMWNANLAADYLRDTDLTVEAIAAILNYHDSSSFRRAFKRWHNVTPQQFRQSQDKSRTSDTR